ncbi:MAG: isoprenylcysteine carboxylmethyltransferase family protein [Ignavibacteriaceae bacterium]|nr:isoprenylcysteine carboxylmethyltransferase family protein [Ignavibacteriaceae bacterium]
MKLAADIVLTAVLISLFCVSHSVLASSWVKKAFHVKFGNLIAYYRIGYNLFSAISLLIIYPFIPQIDVTVYDLPNPYDLIILALQILSLFGLVWCARYFSAGEFLGLSQIKRLKEGNYNSADLDENSTLHIEGPYRYSRHPVYLFSILFLILRPVMGLTYLIIVVIFVLYFYIGSRFEEKRLVEKFGRLYIDYQKSVPRIFPIKIFRA